MYLRTKTLGTFVIITWVNSSSTQVFPGLPRTGIIHIFEKPDEYLGIAGSFLTYETEFVLFLAVLENSVLPMS